MKPVMSADSSWMMSGAVPPWNWVTSWSCTLSQLPWTYSTWMLGLAAFQSATIFLVAATVVFWNARLWNFSVTFSFDDPLEPAELLSLLPPHAASVTKALAASNAVMTFFIASP